MEYKSCSLYGLQSKKQLKELLGIDEPGSFTITAESISQIIKPRIDGKKGKARLIEPPFQEIKIVQKKLLRYLQKLAIPNGIFCGVKGKTVADNAKIHSGQKYVYQTDLSKFFPHITRNKVYNFFNKKMNMSPDIAKMLAIMCTIDYKYVDKERYAEVYEYFIKNKLKLNAHLMTGSPVSCILSYFVNVDMFDLIYQKAQKQSIAMSLYIDDLTFSSEKPISKDFIQYVNKTLKCFGYRVSIAKSLYNTPKRVKKITGVILDKNGCMKVANNMKFRLHKGLRLVNKGQYENSNIIRGCLSFTSLVEPKYRDICKQVYNKTGQNN